MKNNKNSTNLNEKWETKPAFEFKCLHVQQFFWFVYPANSWNTVSQSYFCCCCCMCCCLISLLHTATNSKMKEPHFTGSLHITITQFPFCENYVYMLFAQLRPLFVWSLMYTQRHLNIFFMIMFSWYIQVSMLAKRKQRDKLHFYHTILWYDA